MTNLPNPPPVRQNIKHGHIPIYLIREDQVRLTRLEEIAHIASNVNERMENIGARRLHTVMEKLLDEVSFDAPDMDTKTVTIDREYVADKLGDIIEDENLSRYIL